MRSKTVIPIFSIVAKEKKPKKSLAFNGKSCQRKPYKGYAYGGLVEEKCHYFWCEKKHNYAQQIEFNENNVILYPNNEDPGKILAEKKNCLKFCIHTN